MVSKALSQSLGSVKKTSKRLIKIKKGRRRLESTLKALLLAMLLSCDSLAWKISRNVRKSKRWIHKMLPTTSEMRMILMQQILRRQPKTSKTGEI